MRRLSIALTALLFGSLVVSAPITAVQPASAAGGYWGAQTAAADNRWRAVTFGNNLFVAVSDNGTDRVMTSANGIDWTSRSGATPDQEWKSVTYGANTFVAVGYSGVMTSTDGINWTTQTAPNKKWGEVRFLNGLFVALAWEEQTDDKPIMTSPDGITWTEQTMVTSGMSVNWRLSNGAGLAYGNNVYVALSESSMWSRLATSTNGTTWTARDTSNAPVLLRTWRDLVFGNGKFVAVGLNSMSTSTDGVTWTAVTGDITQYSWTSVVYADNKFVAVDGSGQKKVATSADGITWTILDVDLARSASYSSITYGNGAFVGVANSGMGAESLVLFSNSDRGPVPTITSVSPASLMAGTTSNITITGTGFRVGISVTFGGIACSSPTRESSTRVSCLLPSGVSGVVDVVVTNSDGQSATLAGGLTVTERTTRPTTTTTTAPATQTTNPAGTGSSGSASGETGGSYDNLVPGVTKTDTKVYTTPPVRVAASSAINVLTAAQNRVQDVVTRTPAVCVPNDDELVFLDEGRCVSDVVNARTRQVLRTLRTTVVEDKISELRVGNAVVTLAPIYFGFVSSELDSTALARVKAVAPRATAAGSVLVVGHSGTLNGNSPENVKLSQARSRNTVAALRRAGAKGPFFATGVGALDPALASKTEAAQTKNRRVVIVLVP